MRDEVLQPRMVELAVMQHIGGAADARDRLEIIYATRVTTLVVGCVRGLFSPVRGGASSELVKVSVPADTNGRGAYGFGEIW